jgi:hypothetical protein
LPAFPRVPPQGGLRRQPEPESFQPAAVTTQQLARRQRGEERPPSARSPQGAAHRSSTQPQVKNRPGQPPRLRRSLWALHHLFWRCAHSPPPGPRPAHRLRPASWPPQGLELLDRPTKVGLCTRPPISPDFPPDRPEGNGAVKNSHQRWGTGRCRRIAGARFGGPPQRHAAETLRMSVGCARYALIRGLRWVTLPSVVFAAGWRLQSR